MATPAPRVVIDLPIWQADLILVVVETPRASRFATAQERCAVDVGQLARRLASIQGPSFRRTLGRLITAP